MKKLLFGLLILTSFLTVAQNEIKLDIADALVIRSLEFSYEKTINKEASAGVSVLFNLVEQGISFRYKENFMVTPYYRHYFTTEYKWNFFGEGFLGINSGKKESVKDAGIFDIEYTDAALGVAIGLKYISKGGFVIDVFGGLGRNLFGIDSPDIVPRLGVNVGWRF